MFTHQVQLFSIKLHQENTPTARSIKVSNYDGASESSILKQFLLIQGHKENGSTIEKVEIIGVGL